MEKPIASYRELTVWQKSVQLVEILYFLTASFPKEEVFGLTSQMRRSAVSIPSNIAEGRSRNTRKDFTQFLRIAYGSGAELETQLLIAKRLSLGDISRYNEVEQLLTEVMKMLTVMIRKMSSDYKL